MLPPVTPTKAKAGSYINLLLQDLSDRWNLQLPVRDALWSPSRNTHKSIESQIYSVVQFLYWRKGKAEGALNHAVAEFEENARREWIAKPRAEFGVIPSRNNRATAQQDTFLKRRDISTEKAAELAETFLSVLKSVADQVNAGAAYPVEADSKQGWSVLARHYERD